MEETLQVAKDASRLLTFWLLRQDNVESVKNVEDDREYQRKDIDLLVYMKDGTELKVEVKADRKYNTGNFFIETVSNLNRNTPGCFLYTEADIMFYYFVGQGWLYSIPVKAFQRWIDKNIHKYPVKRTSTVGQRGQYESEGRIVPRRVLVKEIPSIKLYDLDKDLTL